MSFIVETDVARNQVYAESHEDALRKVCGEGELAIAAKVGDEMFFTFANGEEVSVLAKAA